MQFNTVFAKFDPLRQSLLGVKHTNRAQIDEHKGINKQSGNFCLA